MSKSKSFDSQIRDLLRQSYSLGNTPAKVMVLEEAVRLADSHGNISAGFEIRNDLLQAAVFSGCPEKALVAFSWCLAQCDRDPDEYPDQQLLWEYKWIAALLAFFPQLSRQQIAETMADMTRRYEKNGASLRAIYCIELRLALDMGDMERAVEFHSRWKKTPRDHTSDCNACDRDTDISFEIRMGNHAKAVKQAAPILKGTMSCAEIPHFTYARMLAPFVHLERLDEAMQCHQKGYRLVSRQHDFLGAVAEHLTFLVQTDNRPQAVKLFEKHLPWAVETANLLQRLEFYLTSQLLLEQLQTGRQKTRKLRLPKSLSVYQESGLYDLAALSAWFANENRQLAARFDQRNGNDFWTRRMAERLALKDAIVPCPVPTKKTKDADSVN